WFERNSGFDLLPPLHPDEPLRHSSPTNRQLWSRIFNCHTLFGLASIRRTLKGGHWVNCFGIRSQWEKGSPARYGRAGGCRKFRCNRKWPTRLGGGWQTGGDKSFPI